MNILAQCQMRRKNLSSGSTVEKVPQKPQRKMSNFCRNLGMRETAEKLSDFFQISRYFTFLEENENF